MNSIESRDNAISRIDFLYNNHRSKVSYDLPQEIGYYSQNNLQVMDRSMLRIYSPISDQTSLVSGQDVAVLKQEEKAEYLDPLLCAIQYWSSKSLSVYQMVHQANIITWRGLISKLAMTCYLNEAVSLRVCIFNQCLYIMEHKPTISRSSLPSTMREGMYIGHKFEAVMTVDSMGKRDPDAKVNEKEYYISIIKAKLNEHRMLFGAEVDCYDSSITRNPNMSMCQYIELKTTIDRGNRNISDISDEKLLKYWIQSYLAGIPKIVVGYRSRSNGILKKTETFQTNKLPLLLKCKESWNPNDCLLWVHHLLNWIQRYISNDVTLDTIPEYIVSFEYPFECFYIKRKLDNDQEDHLNRSMLPNSWITFILSTLEHQNTQ